MNAVGKNLKQLRQREKLTQDALAERLHVTRQAVSSWETGKTQPDIETLTALAESLDADVRELIYGPEQMKGMHGINENIEYSCLPGAVDFYKNLIRAQEQ